MLYECSSCGADVEDGAKYCVDCGAELDWEDIDSCKFCPNCGEEVATGSKFCKDCGHKLSTRGNAISAKNEVRKKTQPADIAQLVSAMTVCNIIGFFVIPKLFWILSLVKNSSLKTMMASGASRDTFIKTINGCRNVWTVGLVFTLLGDLICFGSGATELSSDALGGYAIFLLVLAVIQIAVTCNVCSKADKAIASLS